ncbi:thioredoxin-like protein [Lipomyces arxii]|uniref:thioredoxin-like protein n=1 Tax=Lipomyces arxii TaxID=56418 RepID=UPI0034CE140D
MLSKKQTRTLVFLGITAFVSLIYYSTRSSGPEYEVPDFVSERTRAKEASGFDPSTHGYDPLIDIRDTLLKSPVVIFSKSYCPHSRFVKTLLTSQYRLDPPPVIRELDLDPHGHEIQDALLEISGRRTVPNVFVGGKSLGGGDEMRLLHSENQLTTAFKKNGGRKFKVWKLN